MNKFKCPGCGKEVEKISHEFRSVINKHHSVKHSNSVKKRLFLQCQVYDVETREKVPVCHDCHRKLSSGMSTGGNIE